MRGKLGKPLFLLISFLGPLQVQILILIIAAGLCPFKLPTHFHSFPFIFNFLLISYTTNHILVMNVGFKGIIEEKGKSNRNENEKMNVCLHKKG